MSQKLSRMKYNKNIILHKWRISLQKMGAKVSRKEPQSLHNFEEPNEIDFNDGNEEIVWYEVSTVHLW